MLSQNFIISTNIFFEGIGYGGGGETLDRSYSKVRLRNQVNFQVSKTLVMNDPCFQVEKFVLKVLNNMGVCVCEYNLSFNNNKY